MICPQCGKEHSKISISGLCPDCLSQREPEPEPVPQKKESETPKEVQTQKQITISIPIPKAKKFLKILCIIAVVFIALWGVGKAVGVGLPPEEVYKLNNSSIYHRAGCHYIEDKGVIECEIEWAQNRDSIRACKICKPDDDVGVIKGLKYAFAEPDEVIRKID